MDPSKPHIKVLAFLVAGAFILVVGITFKIDQMYLMALSVLLMPFLAWVLGRCLTGGIVCKRTVPDTALQGENVRITLDIANTARLPRFYIQIDDKLPPELERVDGEGLVVLQLEAGAERYISYSVTPHMRGVYKIGPASLQTTDPFGLTRARKNLDTASDLVVLPTPLPVRRTILAGGAFGFRGERDGMRRGIGMDFYGIREYHHGDELRSVHWRTTARTGHLVVVEQTQGELISVVLVLDLAAAAYKDSGVGLESAIEYAVKIAATIGDCLIRDGHAVRLVTAQGELLVDATTDVGSFPLLDLLARVQAIHKQTLGEILQATAGLGPGVVGSTTSRGLQETDSGRGAGLNRRAAGRSAPGFSGLPGSTDLPAGGALVYITTDAGGDDLDDILGFYQSRGLSVHGFMLDRSSFNRSAGPPLSKEPSVGKVYPVVKGVNLLRLIEGMAYDRG